MRLNAQTDFALRIMMYLAAKGGETATIQEVATKLELSQAHAMRIAAKLASKGLIASSRGRSGGLALGKASNLITVEEVVSAIEPDFALVQCFRTAQQRKCTIDPSCLLKAVLSSAVRAFLAELRAVTLAELTEPNRVDLAQIFGLGAPSRPVKGKVRKEASPAGDSGAGGVR